MSKESSQTNPTRIVERMERRREAELDRLAELAMRDTDYRIYQATHVPIKRRGRRPHRIQKLSLIALAAQRKYLKRQVLELVHWRVEHLIEEPDKCIEELISIRNFLNSHVLSDVSREVECTQPSQ